VIHLEEIKDDFRAIALSGVDLLHLILLVWRSADTNACCLISFARSWRRSGRPTDRSTLEQVDFSPATSLQLTTAGVFYGVIAYVFA
jgi:hypothetical protein